MRGLYSYAEMSLMMKSYAQARLYSGTSFVQGTVANFVETEQVVELTPRDSSKPPVLSSFVQIRGSIPLLWSQIPNVKYKPPTRMSPEAATEPAFDAHISDILQSYKVLSHCRMSWPYTF